MNRYDLTVTIMPKPEVADPQGQAVREAGQRFLEREGAAGQLLDMRIGKVVALRCTASSAAEAERLASLLADRMLANPNIEKFRIAIGMVEPVSP